MSEKKHGKILIIDDEESILFSLSALLGKQKYICETASSGSAAMKKITENPDEYDIIITDFLMPGMDGMAVLRSVRQLRPEAYVIMLTAHGNTENAVMAMKEGAYDYISKPYENEKMKIVVKQAFERIRLERENITLKKHIESEYKFENIIGTSERMLEVFDKIKKVSATDATVLITGESGTGKELVSRAVHFNGNRRYNNFITLNCAAIPADLLENELFGHEKGAYTGAHVEQKGKFELADGGTLFLDEIGDMPMQIQAKVLRAIQEQIIERLGGSRSVKVDVRLIAATNKNLEDEIAAKRFREDLFYRLNVINIIMPSLRERNGDIALLVKHFVSHYSQKLSKKEPVFTYRAMELMKKYYWPGNVRQLQNTIERVLVLCESPNVDSCDLVQIGALKDAGELLGGPGQSKSGPEKRWPEKASDTITAFYELADIERLSFHEAQKTIVELFERDYITRALRRNSGNVMRTSQQIGLNRAHLYEKLKNLKIDVEQFKVKE